MVAHWAMVVFFLAVGISSFWAFPYAGLIAGVAAIVAGVALIVKQ